VGFVEASPTSEQPAQGGQGATDWQRRVVGRSLEGAKRRSLDRSSALVRAAARVLERTNGQSLTVQEVADEAGQSLRTLYQYFSSKDDLLLAVYEEAMQVYARLLHAAIRPLDDPVERLAGAIIAAARMPVLHQRAGVDRGLSALRLQLSQAAPELVARSQAPVTTLFRELVGEAMVDARTTVGGVDAATYFVCAMRTSFILSMTLGNEYAVEMPDVIDLSCFCVAGLGLERSRPWHEAVDGRLELSRGQGRSILRRLAREPA